jgi:hypothetical protein
MKQEHIILNHFKLHKKITSVEAFYDYGISRLAAVIFDLKQSGHEIVSDYITVINKQKQKVLVKQYRLKGKK